MKRFTRGALGLFTAAGVMLLGESLLWGVSVVAKRDLRVSPLPTPAHHPVLCETEQTSRVKLCPDSGLEYERVRDVEVDLSPRKTRITVIGESFVYGLGLESSEAWPAQLDAMLAPSTEVLNLGRCGTYASRLQPQVEAAGRLKSDLIILSVGNNEHTMTSFFSGVLGRRPLLSFQLLELLGRSQMFGLLSRLLGRTSQWRVQETFDQPSLALTNPTDARVYAARRRPPDLSIFPDSFADTQVATVLEDEQRLKERIFEGHLRRLIRTAQRTGAPVIVTSLPWRLPTAPALSGVHQATKSDIQRIITRMGSPREPDPTSAYLEGQQLDRRVAALHHEAGRAYLRLSRRQEAADAFRRAAEWDLVPDATPSINRIIEQVAKTEDATFVDLHSLSDKWMDDPDRWFIDKVHVSLAGSRAVASALQGPVTEVLARRSETSADETPPPK